MPYRIEAIELYVRDTPPGRMLFTLGSQSREPVPPKQRTNPLGHVRLIVKNGKGESSWGCAGDRLSVRWLDKRAGRSHDLKRRELVSLIHTARDIYRAAGEFESPFAVWRTCHPLIMKAGREQGQEALTCSFASALFERAVVDAVCRLEGKPLFEMLKAGRLGFEPRLLDAAVDVDFAKVMPRRPRTEFFIRHTVGGSDPLVAEEVPAEKRVGDGLPETLAGYVKADGLKYFKVKVSGDVNRDVERLSRVWDVVSSTEEPVITLDANEAYTRLDTFEQLVKRLERDHLGLFQHIAYIEQPLPRGLTLDPKTTTQIRAISERKPLIIDEADGTMDAFERAQSIGYIGTSHKNCKGFFKSLMHSARVHHAALEGKRLILSAEDLQNLPIVPLQQDFTTLGVLGLEHCERNGHHYNRGLCMVSAEDKRNAVNRHPDLYERRGDKWYLRIRDGRVRCASLQVAGFGVRDEPDWKSMPPMNRWVRENHGAT